MDDVPSLEDLANDLAGDSQDVNNEVDKQEPTHEESSTEANKEPEVAEAESEDEAETETDDEAEAEPDETEEQPHGVAEERKRELNEEIRDLVSQRNSIRSEVEQLTAQTYQVQSPQELVDEGLSETDARVEALRQQIEIKDYNDRVADVQLQIGSESQRVLQDFPMFDPQSPQYKPEVAAEAAQILGNSLVQDPNNGQIIGSNVSPYQLYKTIAKASEASAVENQIKGQQSTEKMLASVDAPSSAAPKEAPEDHFLAGLTKGLQGK